MELGLFKEQETIMPGVLSVREIWREKKLERKIGARSHVAFVVYGKEFEFYPNYNGKATEGGRKGRKIRERVGKREGRKQGEKEGRK